MRSPEAVRHSGLLCLSPLLPFRDSLGFGCDPLRSPPRGRVLGHHDVTLCAVSPLSNYTFSCVTLFHVEHHAIVYSPCINHAPAVVTTVPGSAKLIKPSPVMSEEKPIRAVVGEVASKVAALIPVGAVCGGTTGK